MAGLQHFQIELELEESNWHFRDHSLRKTTRGQSRATEPDYGTEIADLKKRIASLESSTSWRITKPLRALKQKR
jgi:hypothetical protein